MNSLTKVQAMPIRLITPLIRLNLISKRMLCSTNKSTSEQSERTASFGFQTVAESEKSEKGRLDSQVHFVNFIE